MEKSGDRLLEELRQRRHEADKLHRLAIWKELMKGDICPECGAHKANYLEAMKEECWHGH